MSKTEIEKTPRTHETNLMPLCRYLHMHDQDNTQIFTFLLLPHLLCGGLDEVHSHPFMYAQNWWILRVIKSTTHLGVFLEFRSTFSPDKAAFDLSKTGSNSTKHLQWETVTLDFQFTLNHQEHFSKNESYARRSCVFSVVQPRHGRRRFIELNDLSSKRFLFDDGKCTLEVELKNAECLLNLWFHQRTDPISPPHATTNGTIELVNLRRMDGTNVQLSRSMHFETNYFSYYGSLWFVTIDFEPYRNIRPEVQIPDGNDSLINVNVEICLVRHVPRARATHRKPTDPPKTRQQVDNYHVKCCAVLPGNCATGLMEFVIGPQGWPKNAHRIRFPGNPTHDKQRSVDGPDQDSDAGSSIRILLLSLVSSPINVSLKMISLARITFLEVPVPSENKNLQNTYLNDPYEFCWNVKLRTAGRVLRLQLHPITRTALVQSGDSESETSQAISHRINSTSTLVQGVELQLNPLDPQLRKPVRPVNDGVAHLVRFTEDFVQCPAQPSEENGYCALLDRTFETVMDITVEEALEKSSALVNPLNGTILVEIIWIYGQLLHASHINSVDMLLQRQNFMMKEELNRIRKERDELERRLMMTEMGLIQVAGSDETRSLGLLPVESLHSFGKGAEKEPNYAAKLIETSDWRAGLRDCPRRSGKANENSGTQTSASLCSIEHNRSKPIARNKQNEYQQTGSSHAKVQLQTSFESDPYSPHAYRKESSTSDGVSVNSDNISLKFHERKRQFMWSKSKWQTYDAGPDGRVPERLLKRNTQSESMHRLLGVNHGLHGDFSNKLTQPASEYFPTQSIHRNLSERPYFR